MRPEKLAALLTRALDPAASEEERRTCALLYVQHMHRPGGEHADAPDAEAVRARRQSEALSSASSYVRTLERRIADLERRLRDREPEHTIAEPGQYGAYLRAHWLTILPALAIISHKPKAKVRELLGMPREWAPSAGQRPRRKRGKPRRKDIDREQVVSALREHAGVLRPTAAALQIPKSTLAEYVRREIPP